MKNSVVQLQSFFIVYPYGIQYCCPALELLCCPTFLLSTPMDNSEATRKKAKKCNKKLIPNPISHNRTVIHHFTCLFLHHTVNTKNSMYNCTQRHFAQIFGLMKPGKIACFNTFVISPFYLWGKKRQVAGKFQMA